MDRTFRSDTQRPQAGTPPRESTSIRRTSHIDMVHDPDGSLRLEGAARDLRTDRARTEVVASASVRAQLGADHVLRTLEIAPEHDGAASLLGRRVGPGFRAQVAAALADEVAAASPLAMLIDELPVAALISGYALLYNGSLGNRDGEPRDLKADICSGWRADGYMIVSIRTKGFLPTPLGPAAPLPDDDPLAWHDMPALALGGMRRQRLVEITDRAGGLEVYAMFRDTHLQEGSWPNVLHEYSVTARVDPEQTTLTNCVAVPHVLPWNECPDAAASATRLNGHELAGLRELVRRDFGGLGTCTHLNDLLRSLGDLAALVPALTRGC